MLIKGGGINRGPLYTGASRKYEDDVKMELIVIT